MATNRRWSRMISLLAATLLVVAVGCGGDEDDDGNGTAGDDTGTQTEDTGTQVEDTGTIDPDTGGSTGTDTSVTDTGEPDTGTDDTGGGGGDDADGGNGGDDADAGGSACTFFPDDCGEGENCYLQMNGRTCGAFNSENGEGDDCGGLNDCDDGLVCSGEGTCRQRCDPDDTANYGCPSERTCVRLVDENQNELPYGICSPECEVYPNDSCPSGENCYPTGSGNACATFNSMNGVGDSCSALNDCDDGLVCISGSCAEKCESDADCSSGSCQGVSNLPYDVCQ